MEEETLSVFEGLDIDLGKLPASCSAIHQASDVSQLFRATKARLSNINTNEMGCTDEALDIGVGDTLKQLNKKLESPVSTDMRKKIKHGVLSIVTALKDVFRPKLVSDGFIATGQHSGKCPNGIDFEKVMSRCYTDFNREQLAHMKEQAPAHAEVMRTSANLPEVMRTSGNLPEVRMDEVDIPSIPDETNSVPRDQRPIQNNRALLVSHRYTVERHVAYVTTRAASRVTDDPDLRKAMRIVDNAERSDQKKRAREHAVTEQRELLAAMSPEERNAEKGKGERVK